MSNKQAIRFKDFNASIQQKLFEILDKKLENLSLVNFLLEHLKISKSNAYKKINGEISLSIKELEYLLFVSEIPLQSLLDSSGNMVGFSADVLTNAPKNPADFLDNLLKHFSLIVDQNDINIKILSNEIPFFHLFQFPKLFALEIFCWNMYNWQHELNTDLFSFEDIAAAIPDLESKIAKLNEFYVEDKCTEVWTLECFTSIFTHIKFLAHSYSFKNSKELTLIFDELELLVNYLETICKKGFKQNRYRNTDAAEIQVYYNQFIKTSDQIIIKTDSLNISYTQFDSPNFIYSLDTNVVDLSTRWCNKVIEHSNLISRGKEQQRRSFFNQLKKKVSGFKSEIEAFSNFIA